MEIKIKLKERHIGILEWISLILFGVFFTSMIFAFLMSPLGELGMWLGLILNILLIGAVFYYREKGSKLRIIAWSMIGTILIFTIGFLIIISSLENALKGL